jgi:ribonuclease III
MLPAFNNQDLLITALTHRSALNEKEQSGTTANESNERLEFLGDAVLELASTVFLYQQRPDDAEGMLTTYRSALVRTETLAKLAKELGLDQRMYLSRGEEAGGGRDNPGLLADLLEAVIGALYLDQGFSIVQSFLEKVLFPKFADILASKAYRDQKSLLQEMVQARSLPTPIYRVVKEEGPDHNKLFTVEVLIGKEVWGLGQGQSKQRAQQASANMALKKFMKNDGDEK